MTTAETVTDQQILHFREHGFVRIPGILSQDEVETYRALAMNFQERKLAELDEVRGGKVFHQFVN